MAQSHQFVSQPGDNTFRASIELGRDRFGQRRYLRDMHSIGKPLSVAEWLRALKRDYH
jgi:hypothetical protein